MSVTVQLTVVDRDVYSSCRRKTVRSYVLRVKEKERGTRIFKTTDTYYNKMEGPI